MTVWMERRSTKQASPIFRKAAAHRRDAVFILFFMAAVRDLPKSATVSLKIPAMLDGLKATASCCFFRKSSAVRLIRRAVGTGGAIRDRNFSNATRRRCGRSCVWPKHLQSSLRLASFGNECFMSMSQNQIASGVVHDTPTDLRSSLISDPKALAAWETITPLARNEWICWIESAKKAETRNRRIERARTELLEGKRRPCCWPGCPHR